MSRMTRAILANLMRHLTWSMLCVLTIFLCACAEADEGRNVRVYLTRFESDNAIQVLSHSTYMSSDGSLLLQENQEISFILQGDRIIVHCSSAVIDAGKRIELVCVDDKPGSFEFVGNQSIFTGNLTLAVKDGKILPVLTADVEDYLLGVVPYEMGDSFPLEALKAQAVAARTYALSRRNAAQEYDVVDNTNDQVYRGKGSDNPVSERAVHETEGMVGVYKGKLATCYYTASNGGQTELGQNAWPEKEAGIYGYMEQKDDPYDLANERSPVKRCTIPKKPDAEFSQKVKEGLVSGISSELKKAGLPQDNDLIQIDEILSIAPCSPKYSQQSKVLKTVKLRLRVSYRDRIQLRKAQEGGTVLDADGNPQYVYTDYKPYDKEIEAEVSYFGLLEQAFGLSINVTENEVLTILETKDAFVLEARRYGHGVGMSQRGAEEMANRKKSYLDILAFYYPGLTIEAYPAEASPNATPRPELVATARPTPSPTPRPSPLPVTEKNMPKGSFLASVEGIAEDSWLNMREGPSLSSEIVRKLFKGQRLIVTETTNDGWAHVSTDVLSGFVRLEYLEQIK